MQGYEGRRRLDPQPGDGLPVTDGGSHATAAARRDAGVRQTRRISTWTAAALVASIAAGAGYFAHTAATSVPGVSGTSVTGTANGAGATGQKPSLTHPVVTSGGSGVVAGAGGGAGGSGGAGSGGAANWRDN